MARPKTLETLEAIITHLETDLDGLFDYIYDSGGGPLSDMPPHAPRNPHSALSSLRISRTASHPAARRPSSLASQIISGKPDIPEKKLPIPEKKLPIPEEKLPIKNSFSEEKSDISRESFEFYRGHRYPKASC